MDDHAFLQWFGTTASKGFWLFGSRRLVAHFMHIVWSWPRRAGAAAPVVGIIDTHLRKSKPIFQCVLVVWLS